MSDYFKINIGAEREQQFKNDVQVEYDAVKRLNDGIHLCSALNDAGSRELLNTSCVDEEHHIDWLEAQLTLIEQMGIQNYLALAGGRRGRVRKSLVRGRRSALDRLFSICLLQ